MGEWLTPPQGKIPFVFGPASTTSGYYALEDAARGSALETLSLHQREATLWYRALTLHLEAQKGKWPPLPDIGTELQRFARNAQIDLLALSACCKTGWGCHHCAYEEALARPR